MDRPIIQHAVEEALSAGITELIFVTAETKQIIRDHFQPNALKLERELALSGVNRSCSELVKNIPPPGISLSRYVIQHDPLGLGHAVLCARPLVGDEPFAVILPDDLVHHSDAYLSATNAGGLQGEETPASVAVENVAREQVSRYGIVETSHCR